MEYEASRAMPASKQQAYQVAADVERMETWLPTTFDVGVNADGTVHIEGEAPGGQRYSRDGLWSARDEQLRLEWGSEEDGRYAGWLQFTGIEDDASEAVLHLSFLGEQEMAAEHDEQMDVGMAQALDRLAAVVAARES